MAAAIDKYVYVAVNEKYDGSIRAAYSITENVQSVDELRHELIRAALLSYPMHGGVEIHSIADIPGGTGLGSSSAFMVGLIRALTPTFAPDGLSAAAATLEISFCQKPIGKQDQYTAAYGGVNLLSFSSQGVTVAPIACDLDALSSHCLLLDTGLARAGDAGAVLAGQTQDRDDVRTLATLARSFAQYLADGDLLGCGCTMHGAWMVKQRFVGTPQIDRWYFDAMQAGAWGGKLCGAGGGGFMLFLAPPERHAAIVQVLGLRHVPIRVGVPGCQVVYS